MAMFGLRTTVHGVNHSDFSVETITKTAIKSTISKTDSTRSNEAAEGAVEGAVEEVAGGVAVTHSVITINVVMTTAMETAWNWMTEGMTVWMSVETVAINDGVQCHHRDRRMSHKVHRVSRGKMTAAAINGMEPIGNIKAGLKQWNLIGMALHRGPRTLRALS